MTLLTLESPLRVGSLMSRPGRAAGSGPAARRSSGLGSVLGRDGAASWRLTNALLRVDLGARGVQHTAPAGREVGGVAAGCRRSPAARRRAAGSRFGITAGERRRPRPLPGSASVHARVARSSGSSGGTGGSTLRMYCSAWSRRSFDQVERRRQRRQAGAVRAVDQARPSPDDTSCFRVEHAERGLGRRGVGRADRGVAGLAGADAGGVAPRPAAAAAPCGSRTWCRARRRPAGAGRPSASWPPRSILPFSILRVARSSARSVRPMRTCDERGIDELDGVAAGRLGLRPAPCASAAAGTDRDQARRDARAGRRLGGSAWSELLCRGGTASSGQARRRPVAVRAPGGGPGVVAASAARANADPANADRDWSRRRARRSAMPIAWRCSASSATPGKRSATAGRPRSSWRSSPTSGCCGPPRRSRRAATGRRAIRPASSPRR